MGKRWQKENNNNKLSFGDLTQFSKTIIVLAVNSTQLESFFPYTQIHIPSLSLLSSFLLIIQHSPESQPTNSPYTYTICCVREGLCGYIVALFSNSTQLDLFFQAEVIAYATALHQKSNQAQLGLQVRLLRKACFARQDNSVGYQMWI